MSLFTGLGREGRRLRRFGPILLRLAGGPEILRRRAPPPLDRPRLRRLPSEKPLRILRRILPLGGDGQSGGKGAEVLRHSAAFLCDGFIPYVYHRLTDWANLLRISSVHKEVRQVTRKIVA